MAIVLKNIIVPLTGTDEDINNEAAKQLSIGASEIEQLRIKKQSIDSRKPQIKLVYTLHVTLFDKTKQQALENKFGKSEEYHEQEIVYGTKDPGRPVVIGAGPCGLFAALTLAQHGYRPLLLERGRDIKTREKDVGRLMQSGVLNEESNVCFGAGGAGAFSDGKLTTRIKDGRAEIILKTLVDFGAPKEIIYAAKPHAGSEHIRTAVSAMIGKITELGGEVRYQSRLSGLSLKSGRLSGLSYICNGLPQTVETNAAILAIGHSARDTYAMLKQSGVMMAPKPFAVGLRIEHRRAFIDKAQYGDAFLNPRLGAAEYRLTSKWSGRGVYTFCMCPGGEVICSSTEENGIAVNGMSYYARNAENSNSAVVVSVNANDFGTDVLDGVRFQRMMEQAAYTGGYAAPAQRFGDFLLGRATQQFGGVTPSYKPGTAQRDLHDCLPVFIADALKAGITRFGEKLKGFDMPDAVLTGIETRTSSPVRILRQEDMNSAAISGLFPAGEGAGYAGGIVSAAVDGIRCAEALMRAYAKPQLT